MNPAGPSAVSPAIGDLKASLSTREVIARPGGRKAFSDSMASKVEMSLFSRCEDLVVWIRSADGRECDREMRTRKMKD